MAGLASLLRRRGNPALGRDPAKPWDPFGSPTSNFQRRRREGLKNGGQVKGYQGGGVPVGGGYGEYVKGFLGKTSGPGMREWARDRANKASHIQQAQRNLAPPRLRGGQTGGYVGGYQIGGEVGVAPEEVAMASEIFARATPEQQAQITGGGGPGMMDEEAAIGEALAMAMGGGGGGPPMGGPPMGGPPMNGAPPMGGLI